MKLCVAVAAAFVGSATAFVPAAQNGRLHTTLFGRKAFITGNWKLNPSTKDEAVALATGIANAVTPSSPGDVALFVPYPFLESVHQAVEGKVTIGAEVRPPAIPNSFTLQTFQFSFLYSVVAVHYSRGWRCLHRRSFGIHAQVSWN
jgi:hypothetical protein